MNEKISVVIPVYQVELYVEECIKSICNQTYSNLEIILVDDGSKDKSGEICDKYAKIDSRIKVIHKENGGLSDARNKGIDIATGDYICFIDSDDKVSIKYVETLYNLIKENDFDIAVCDFQSVKKDEDIKEEDKGVKKIYSSQDALKESYKSDTGLPFIVAWNKLYKTEMFKDIRYPFGKINEDEFTTYKLIYNAKRIIYTSEKLYYYFQRDNDSIMRKKYNKKRLDIIDAYEERLKFYDEKNEKELYDITFQNYCYTLNIHYACCRLYLNEEKICKIILKKIRYNRKQLLKTKTVSLKSKISYTITSMFPSILVIRFRKYLRFFFG